MRASASSGTYGVSVISSRSAMVGGDEGIAGGEEKNERRGLNEAQMPRRRHAHRHRVGCQASGSTESTARIQCKRTHGH